MRCFKALFLLVLILCVSTRSAHAATPRRLDVDSTGQIWGIVQDNALVPLQGFFQVAAPNWRPYAGPRQAMGAAYSENADVRRWSANVRQAGLGGFRFEQTLREQPDAAQIDVSIRAETALTLDGVFYRFYVPASVFAGGRCTLSGAAPLDVGLPEAGKSAALAQAPAATLTFADAAGNCVLTIAMDQARTVRISSGPGWGQPFYDVLIWVRTGNMASGQEAPFSVRLTVAGRADHSPARLRLDASKDLYRLDGFGGTYCYWPDTAVMPYTLEHLNPAWARTQMSLDQWEPNRDKAHPKIPDWQAFRDDQRGDWGLWVLQGELCAATLANQRHIPLIISDWRVPRWMQQPGAGEGAIARQAWPDLAESIISYLLFLKNEHKIEPALFSFNEADNGKMRDPADQRDFFKLLGLRLEQSGLKTRLLAADVSTPGGRNLDYARTILADADARRYIAALSFHTWGGADDDTYRAWGALARQYNLPLFVAETGWDPMPTGSENTLRYSLEELRIYQQVLTLSQPQVMLEWEFGKGFRLLVPDEAGRLQPTFRYSFVAQYCTLTPRPATAVQTQSDNAQVYMTAFRAAAPEGGLAPQGGTVYTIHIANLGADRPAVIEGLPPGARSLRAVQTSPTGYFQELGVLTPAGGALTLQLAPCSLLTLTWQEPLP